MDEPKAMNSYKWDYKTHNKSVKEPEVCYKCGQEDYVQYGCSVFLDQKRDEADLNFKRPASRPRRLVVMTDSVKQQE